MSRLTYHVVGKIHNMMSSVYGSPQTNEPCHPLNIVEEMPAMWWSMMKLASTKILWKSFKPAHMQFFWRLGAGPFEGCRWMMMMDVVVDLPGDVYGVLSSCASDDKRLRWMPAYTLLSGPSLARPVSSNCNLHRIHSVHGPRLALMCRKFQCVVHCVFCGTMVCLRGWKTVRESKL